MKNELEATFLSINKEEIREKLRSEGFKLIYPEYLMVRKTLDLSKIAPNRNIWGRVRQEANKITLAIKEIVGTGIEDVYETEISVNDFETAVQFMEALGATTKSHQENLREMWHNAELGIDATIDTWPGLDPFIEIEGTDIQQIKTCSEHLGLNYDTDAVFGSIDLVYQKQLGIDSKTIITLPEITFQNPAL